MDSNRSFSDRINYALTLGLRPTKDKNGDHAANSISERSAEQTLLGLDCKPEPSFVYTIKMKYKIDGVDWRRESRWKNINVQASDGFSLPFHGTLLRSAAENFFYSVSLSTPDAPVENFPLPMFKTDGLLVLHDLVYKGYATIPRNMLIDILIQLSEIDPALIKSQENQSAPPKAESPIPTVETTTHKKCLKKRLSFKQRMARALKPPNKFRRRPKPMKWNVTNVTKPIESPKSPLEPPTISADSTLLSNQPTTSTPPIPPDLPQKEEPQILTIDLFTPTSTPSSSPNSKSPAYCPESSSESILKHLLAGSSSPESSESPKSPEPRTPSEVPKPSPTKPITPQLRRRPTLIPPSMQTKLRSHSSSSPSPSPPTSPKPSNGTYKRARMSTSRSRNSYLEKILNFKRRLNILPAQNI